MFPASEVAHLTLGWVISDSVPPPFICEADNQISASSVFNTYTISDQPCMDAVSNVTVIETQFEGQIDLIQQ